MRSAATTEMESTNRTCGKTVGMLKQTFEISLLSDDVHKTYASPVRRNKFNPRRQPILVQQRRKMPPSLINQIIEPPSGIETNFDSPGYEYENRSDFVKRFIKQFHFQF